MEEGGKGVHEEKGDDQDREREKEKEKERSEDMSGMGILTRVSRLALSFLKVTRHLPPLPFFGHLSINLSVCLSVYLSVCQAAYLSIHLFNYLHIYLSTNTILYPCIQWSFSHPLTLQYNNLYLHRFAPSLISFISPVTFI